MLRIEPGFVVERPRAVAEVVALLAEHGAAFVAGAGAPGALPAVVAALHEAW